MGATVQARWAVLALLALAHSGAVASAGAARQLFGEERPGTQEARCPEEKTYMPRPHTPTALMSFPGSGNTWTRHILETLTGYHTSSVYCDRSLAGVFTAECDEPAQWGKSIAVKTHVFGCGWKRAVLVVRDPVHAILSDYQRFTTARLSAALKKARGSENMHTTVVEASMWDWRDWHDTSAAYCRRYTASFSHLFGGNGYEGCGNSTDFKVLFFEDLKTASGGLNPYFLDELLEWFGIDREESYYDCVLAHDEGQFARKLPADHPANVVGSDTETMRRMQEGGCLETYERLRRRFPRLPQPTADVEKAWRRRRQRH